MDIYQKGFGFISKDIMQNKNIHITAKAIYAYLCSFAGNNDVAFPSRTKMCEDLCISNDTLGKYIKQLVKFGYIGIIKNKVDNKFTNNTYKLYKNVSLSPMYFINTTELTVDLYKYFIEHIINVKLPELSSALCKLDYKVFLKTLYWQAVSKYIKENHLKCNSCHSSSTLQVHHKNYKHHGSEHLQDVMEDDLELLCKACHEIKHLEDLNNVRNKK